MSEKTEKLTITLPSDREIVMTRVFEAPRELVFKAMFTVEHVEKWWGWRENTVHCELDFRPGGHWRFVQHSPDGPEHAFHGEFREIVPNERVVQTFEYEGMPGHVVVQTLRLEEHEGRTTVTSTSLFATTEERDGMVESGMETGAAESYNRLDEVLATLV
jgi:uncharacterized protein YndB with AHSA1/START domain